MKKRMLSVALAVILTLALAPVAFAAGQTVNTSDFELTNVLREQEVVYQEEEDSEGVSYMEYVVAEGATMIFNKDWFGSRMRSFTDPQMTDDGEVTFEWSEQWQDIEIKANENVLVKTNACYYIGTYGYLYVLDNAIADEFAKANSVDTEPAAPAPASKTVKPTASTVYVDGTAEAFEAYNIDGNNYFKLRDLAYVLNGTDKQFEVGYDNATKAITLTSGQAYTSVGGEMAQGDGTSKTAAPTASKVYLDGDELSLTAYNIGGYNFFKLRDLMQAVDVYVGYDNATKNITLDTSKGYVVE